MLQITKGHACILLVRLGMQIMCLLQINEILTFVRYQLFFKLKFHVIECACG